MENGTLNEREPLSSAAAEIRGFSLSEQAGLRLAMFNMLERLQEDLLNMRIIQRIIHRLAFLATLDDPHVAE